MLCTDTCVLPVWMLEQLKYEPGQDMMFRVRHLTHAPEKADYIKYQPHNYAFDKVSMVLG